MSDRLLFDAGGSLDDVIRITKTSGSTGRPKFMENSRKIMENIFHAREGMICERNRLSSFVSLYSFQYRQAYIDTMLTLRKGWPVILTTTEDLASDLQGNGTVHTLLLPGDALRLARESGVGSECKNDCVVHVDGGFLSQSLRTALLRTVASAVHNNYSTNETNCLARVDPDGVGLLLPDVSVRIVDDSGETRGPGETGSILARSSRMVGGYLWNDALSATHFANGWFRTNDLGYIPEPGRLVVLGRSDDMLNIGGIKIPPALIEEQLRMIDGVIDAVLVEQEVGEGVGELAVCIERRGAHATPRLRQQIATIVNSRAGPFRLYFLDRMPRTGNGKVQRNQLRKLIDGAGRG
jgi:acyl-coenzyme A synthetase/AMP-(fatty) acid ligase